MPPRASPSTTTARSRIGRATPTTTSRSCRAGNRQPAVGGTAHADVPVGEGQVLGGGLEPVGGQAHELVPGTARRLVTLQGQARQLVPTMQRST